MSEFNPSDPKYKKVEDLPLEVRDRFVNTVGLESKSVNGFVREDVYSEKEALKDAKEAGTLPPQDLDESKTYRILEKIRETFSPADALGMYLYDFAANRIGEMEERKLEENIDSNVLRRREGARAELENYIEEQIDQARFQVFSRSKERLRRKGHTGGLSLINHEYEEYPDANMHISGHDKRLEGEVDGNHICIHFHYRNEYIRHRNRAPSGTTENTMSGVINGQPLSDYQARELWHEYSDCAADVLSFDKYERDLLSNGKADDKTIAEMIQQKKEKIIDLKKSEKTVAEARAYEKAVEEELAKENAERIKREEEAKDPEVAVAKLVESLLPRKSE